MSPGHQGPLDDAPAENNSLSDRNLKRFILEQLDKHVEIDSSHVEITVKDCFVFLTGSVESEQTRATIKSLVEGIDGVEDVVSYTELKDPLL